MEKRCKDLSTEAGETVGGEVDTENLLVDFCFHARSPILSKDSGLTIFLALKWKMSSALKG